MKREADRQITKDDSEAGDDVPTNGGTFQKASAEVLATRRIIKVRRTIPPKTAEPSVNPFSAVAEVPPAPTAEASTRESDEKPAENTTEAKEAVERVGAKSGGEEVAAETGADVPAKTGAPEKGANDTNSPEPVSSAKGLDKMSEPQKTGDDAIEGAVAKNVTTEKSVAANDIATEKSVMAKDVAAEKGATSPELGAPTTKSDATPETATQKPPIVPGTSDVAPATNAETQHESVEAAVAENGKEPNDTGAGDDESAKKEAVETAPDVVPPLTGKAAGSVGTPTPALETKNSAPPAIGQPFAAPFSFGGPTGAAPLTFANAAAADNGSSFSVKPSPASEVQAAKPAQPKEFKEATVETGEENERELFRTRAKLYSLEVKEDASRWKERGVGHVKLNVHSETGKARLIMRTEATLRVVLNTPVFRGMTLDRATERSLRFQGYDVDSTDATARTSFLLRLSTSDALSELVRAIEDWKKTAQA